MTDTQFLRAMKIEPCEIAEPERRPEPCAEDEAVLVDRADLETLMRENVALAAQRDMLAGELSTYRAAARSMAERACRSAHDARIATRWAAGFGVACAVLLLLLVRVVCR